MGPQFLALWLSLLGIANAAFWTVTSNFQLDLTTSSYTYRSDSTDYYTYSTTRTMKSEATPTGSPYSATTSARTYADIEIISRYYTSGVVAESDLVPARTALFDVPTTSSSFTFYYMDVTYTAPATCTNSFTFSTTEMVVVPLEATDLVKPYSTEVDSSRTTWVSAYLTSGAAPFTTSTAIAYSLYVRSCRTPYSFPTGRTTSGGGGTSYRGGSDDDCGGYYECTLQIYFIVLAVLLPSLFLLGFLESWLWFRRLMLGKSCLRGGTICWVFITLITLCFTRKQSARSTDDQKLLREQWKKMSGGKAWKLWWKWGFKHRYPEQLLGQYSRNTVGINPLGTAQPTQQVQQPQQPQMQSPAPPQQMVFGPPPPPGHQGYVNQQGQIVFVPIGQPIYGQPGQPVYAPAGQPMSPPPMQQYQGQPTAPPAPYGHHGGISPVAGSPGPQSTIVSEVEKDGSTITELQSNGPR